MINTKKVWMNGKLVNHDEANIHVLSHVVHYGSSFFEGIRLYKTENGPAIFRLKEHVKRLFDSAKIYRTEIPYTHEEVEQAIIDTVKDLLLIVDILSLELTLLDVLLTLLLLHGVGVHI